MKEDPEQPEPWWADYSRARLLSFLVVLIVASAVPAGVLRALLVIRFGVPDVLLSTLSWALTMGLPILVLLWMRRSGRDGWLLRKDLRESRGRETKD